MPALTGPGPLTPAALLTELLPALEHIHGLGLVHRDLKPENIFLRSHEPFDLVLGDFGLVRLVEGEVRFTRGGGTAPYMPPEAVSALDSEASPAWDWWSLGMICAELAGGRHPFALAGGKMASDERIYASLAQRPPDLSAVTGERDLLLCRGLLVADRRRRWGAEQVRAWLAGESPALPASAAAAPAGARTVLFAGADHASAASLAAAFQARWDEALTLLFQERDGVLVDELKDLLAREHKSDAAAALTDQVLPADVGVRFARLLAKMDPGLEPRVGTISVTPQGLEEAAWNIVQHPGERFSLASALRTVQACAVLRSWRTLAGMERGPQIERAWLELIHAYEQAVGPPVTADARPDPDLAAAWLLRVALDPEPRLAEARERVVLATTSPAAEIAWWADLARRREEPAAQVAALLTQGAAEVTGREALEKRRCAEEEARRANEALAEARAEALRQSATIYRGNYIESYPFVLGTGFKDYPPAVFASAYQRNWQTASRNLFMEPDPVLVDALAALLRAQDREQALGILQTRAQPRQHDTQSSSVVASDLAGGCDALLARLLVEMDPALKPLVNDVQITPEGLERAVLRFASYPGPGDRDALVDTLRIVRTSRVLTAWSHLPGCAGGPKIGKAWDDRLTSFEKRRGSLSPRDWQPRPIDADLAGAWLLLTIVSPDGLEQLRERVDNALAGPAGEVAWWKSLAEEASPESMVLALLSQRAARRVEGAEQARRKAEAAHEREREEAQQQAEEMAWAETRRIDLSTVAAAIGFNVLPTIIVTIWAAPMSWAGSYVAALTTLACFAAGASVCSLIIYRLSSMSVDRLISAMWIGAAFGAALTIALFAKLATGHAYGQYQFPVSLWLVYPAVQVLTVFLAAVSARRSR